MTDDSFHDIGVAGADRGRGALFPDIDVLQFAFKTPTLRDVARRAPYLHDGSEATLADVMDFYNDGGRAKRPSLAAEIVPLGLTKAECAQLVAFLETLTSEPQPIGIPALPR
jgi:cytochrome c peroxidase